MSPDPLTFARLVDPELYDLSGKVFYSSPAAFSAQSNVYLLGLNPGGSAKTHAAATIRRNLAEWVERSADWCEYTSESWEGAEPGEHGLAPRIKALFQKLELDLRNVPASNVVFVRSNNEATLNHKDELLARSWPVHEAVIRTLGVTTILCLGGTAGRWVRSMLGADLSYDHFDETYPERHWRSEAHLSTDGLAVVTLTHPSRANWSDQNADPSPLVKRVLSRSLMEAQELCGADGGI